MSQLKQLIINEIDANNGLISFAHFMQLALYTPEIGYYTSNRAIIGGDGDFITAPEISPLFAQCLAQQCQNVLADNDRNIILEFGAGRGHLAADLLLNLEQLDCLPAEYHILEVSAHLQQRQAETIQQRCPHLAERVIWRKQLEQTFSGIVIANEVLDAMPVERFKILDGRIWQIGLTHDQGELKWQLSDELKLKLQTHVHQLQQHGLAQNEAYESEINLWIKPWLESINQCLTQGIVLLIDYGFPQNEYYHPDRNMGTLMCHHQHQAHTDPLLHLGEQDITAHVDFTCVAQAAIASGFQLAGYTSQASFLLNCGLIDEVSKLQQNADSKAILKINQAIKLLTLPSEMGELFKVMALSKQFDEPLIGFQQHDRSGSL